MQDSLPAGGLRLYREGVEPSGSLRKVSGYITILLSRTCPVARVVYAKPPFGGPDAVLAYLSRYTHRIATANSRLVAFDGQCVTFKWKDYRAKSAARYKLMTLNADEFIRRFLIHVLPDGFHRIRHYGFFANANRAANIALARQLLGAPAPARRQKRPVALKVLNSSKRGTLVLAAAGVWLSSRPSNPAASRDCGPFPQSGSTARDQHAPAAITHRSAYPTPISHRQRRRSAHSNCQRRLPPPKRRSFSTASPFRLHPRCSKLRSRHSLSRLSRSKVKNQVKYRR
jgi:hypothetical protein